ncbi:MAG: SDR family oxidoreductase [Planctomycetota bacterium]|nr:MAG: SDR family oxidoreductase [Planctomycetota bacterium]
MRLDGRTVLITGGTQGVGAAIARRLAEAGCDVLVHGLRDDEAAAQTLAECRRAGVAADLILGDLARPPDQAIGELMQRLGDRAATISLLVNNAGTYCDRPFLDMDVETFSRTWYLNVAAGYFLTQAFARRWIPAAVRGRVLFTGSINGVLAEPDHTAYDTSKGAVLAMVRSLCVALAPYGIRINAMSPGLVVTPLTEPALRDPAAMAWMQLHTPNRQVPGPEVCAGAALFLLSDEAEHIHGQNLLVDGGMSVWQQPDLPDALRSKLTGL